GCAGGPRGRASAGAGQVQALGPPGELPGHLAGREAGWPSLLANRQLIALLLPTSDRSLFVKPIRQWIALPCVGPACLQRALRPLSPLPPARVPSVGNRPRPHHGGTHARRICGTPTCHRAPPWRPAC